MKNNGIFVAMIVLIILHTAKEGEITILLIKKQNLLIIKSFIQIKSIHFVTKCLNVYRYHT